MGDQSAIHNDPGQPVRIAAAVPGAPVDLSPLTVCSVTYNGRSLELDPPLTLVPTLDDESGQLYMAVDESLGVHVFAPTREQLADELAEQLLFLWDTYAQEDPRHLTESAQHLRDELRTRLREVA